MLLGAHEGIAGGVSKAFARAEVDGADCLQIFTRNARGWAARPLTFRRARNACTAEAGSLHPLRPRRTPLDRFPLNARPGPTVARAMHENLLGTGGQPCASRT